MQDIGKENVSQFVTVPSMDLEEKGLEMKDLVIYAYLKKHYNHITKEAYPSLQLLVEESGISKPTIMKSIARLEKAGYISIRNFKKTNHYTFSDINKFEIYSFDFLDDKTLSTSDKAYIICMQPRMLKSSNNLWKMTYSDVDLAKMFNIDLRTFKKYEEHMQNREVPILTIVPTQKRDPHTGLMINERIFDLEAYSNTIALKFMEQDSKINQMASKEEVDIIRKENQELKRQILELQKIVHTQDTQILLT